MEQVQQEQEVKRYNSVVLETPMGKIAFFNTHLVTEKMIAIMEAALEESCFEPEGYGIYSVVFRGDGLPINEDGELNNWVYYSDSMSTVCNIEHCIDMAVRESLSNEYEHSEKVNFKVLVWQTMLSGFFHELHHGHSYLTEGEKVFEDEELLAEEEERANEFARTMLFTLAKKINIEPEFVEEMHVAINERWDEELKLIEENWGSATDKEKSWFTCQKKMIFDQSPVWYDPGEEDEREYIMNTYKEFLHWVSGEDAADSEWNTDTSSIPVLAQKTTEVPSEYYEENPPFEPDSPAGFQGVETTQPASGFQGAVQQPETFHEVVVQQPGHQAVQQPGPAPQHQAPAQPAVVETGPVYESPQMDTASFQNVVKGLYLKIFQNIFQGCGFNPTGNPPFMDGAKICEPVAITRQETMVVKSMLAYNQSGQVNNFNVENAISGLFMNREKTLPGYDLTLTDVNGNSCRRKFIPQNPNKVRQDGQLSATAKLAREGHQIMWIIDPDSPDKQFALRVWNGVLQSNAAGQWVNV